MIPVSLEDVDENHLQQLVDDAVLEAKTIEYKEEWNPNSDAHKGKFLAEITSFANARGGDLILGIGENDNGEPDAVTGMEIPNSIKLSISGEISPEETSTHVFLPWKSSQSL